MHGKHACYVSEAEARGLLKDQSAKLFGTKKKTRGLRLTVPLSKVTGNGQGERSLTVDAYTGTRFLFKQKVRTASNGTQAVFRYKRLHVTESPEWALKRILTAPALEADTYQPYYQCSVEERRSNPVHVKRQSVAAIFRISGGLRRSRVRSAVRADGASSPSAPSHAGTTSRPRTRTPLAILVSEAQNRRMNRPSPSADGITGTRLVATTM